MSAHNLTKEFGGRLVTLHTGVHGIRSGVSCLVNSVEGDSPVLDFIASDNTLDRYNEVIDQNGWQLDNFRANPVIPDCHDYSSVSRILGRAINVGVTGGRLTNRVEFAVDANPVALMAYKMAKGGFLKSQSVGFIPVDWKTGKDDNDPHRTYTKAELLEISMVVVPANPGATVGIKSALAGGAIDRSELKKSLDFLMALCVTDTDMFVCPNCGEAKGQKIEERFFCPDCGHSMHESQVIVTDAKRHFCGSKAASRGHAGASASGYDEAHLMQIAKGLREILGLKP